MKQVEARTEMYGSSYGMKMAGEEWTVSDGLAIDLGQSGVVTVLGDTDQAPDTILKFPEPYQPAILSTR